MPATFTELLPRREHRAAPAMRWTPADEPSGPRVGVLAIDTPRAACVYAVETFPADGAGYGVCLLKLAPGTDATEGHYCLSVAPGGVACECKGFVRWGHCKHADAVSAALANGWL